MDDRELRAIRDRWARIPPPPWRWSGNIQSHCLELQTLGNGGMFLMQFVRWGWDAGQPRFPVYEGGQRDAWRREANGWMQPVHDKAKDGPVKQRTLKVGMVEKEVIYRGDIVGIDNPVARCIEHSAADVATLLAEVDRLRAELQQRDAA